MLNRDLWRRLCRSLAFQLLMAGLILYTLYHCVAAFSDRVVTDVVAQGVDRHTVTGQAVIFRDETVLTVEGGGGLCSYPVSEGTKINATTTFAELYQTGADAETLATVRAQLKALDRQIALAQELPTADMLSHLPALQATAKEQLIANNRLYATGTDWDSLVTATERLILTLSRIGALTGNGGGSGAQLAALRAQRASLLSSVGYLSRTLTLSGLGSDSTGGYLFYASSVDGYEDIFHRADLASMTILDYDTLMDAPPRSTPSGKTVVGKLVSGFRWSITLPVSYDISQTLEVGEQYQVNFLHETCGEIPMTLDRIIPASAEGRAILVLSADETPAGFGYTRFSQVELTLTTYEGYRIPETALIEAEGTTGVYILDGGRVSYRAVDILTRGEGYVLVYAPTEAERTDESDSTYHRANYLDIRDIIITEGEDLYDGKYIE